MASMKLGFVFKRWAVLVLVISSSGSQSLLGSQQSGGWVRFKCKINSLFVVICWLDSENVNTLIFYLLE